MHTIKTILIVGGGSSGWMTAAYLGKVLPGVAVTLVESAGIPVIGVGEATIPFIRDYLRRLGFSEDRSWMPACDATYKTGILYKNWLEKGDVYWHPFEHLDYLDAHTHTGHGWLHLHKKGHPSFQRRSSFYNAFFSSMTLNVQNRKAPAFPEYAYHFDAHQFVELLKQASPQIEVLVDEVTTVGLDEQGAIAGLSTKAGRRLSADLYIDCTGFRRLLISRVAPGQAFISYADSLFCDRAVVLHFPYESEVQKRALLDPYVTASAQSAGWIWTIPLYSRISSGYVFSGDFLSEEQAEEELRRYWGAQAHSAASGLRLRFDTGKLPRLWIKNCVAIGLSGGFIEPLESTGLAVTQLGVEMLTSMIDARYYDEHMTDRYNGYLDKFYTDIFHFIIAHYCFTERTDTEFWKTVRNETALPDELRARLDVFARYLPTTGTKGLSEVWMFRDFSWFCVLLGMGFDFDCPVLDEAAIREIRRLLAARRKWTEQMMRQLPEHADHLAEKIHRTSAFFAGPQA